MANASSSASSALPLPRATRRAIKTGRISVTRRTDASVAVAAVRDRARHAHALGDGEPPADLLPGPGPDPSQDGSSGQGSKATAATPEAEPETTAAPPDPLTPVATAHAEPEVTDDPATSLMVDPEDNSPEALAARAQADSQHWRATLNGERQWNAHDVDTLVAQNNTLLAAIAELGQRTRTPPPALAIMRGAAEARAVCQLLVELGLVTDAAMGGRVQLILRSTLTDVLQEFEQLALHTPTPVERGGLVVPGRR